MQGATQIPLPDAGPPFAPPAYTGINEIMIAERRETYWWNRPLLWSRFLQ